MPVERRRTKITSIPSIDRNEIDFCHDLYNSHHTFHDNEGKPHLQDTFRDPFAQERNYRRHPKRGDKRIDSEPQ